MKFTKPLIASAILLATSSIAFADEATIDIQVTNSPTVALAGTALTKNNSFTTAEVDNQTVDLGLLGSTSNTTGTCDMTISSAKFKLVHQTDATKDLGAYELTYAGTTFKTGNTNTLSQPCESTPTTFQMVHPAITGNTVAGVYSDTVTITVATQ